MVCLLLLNSEHVSIEPTTYDTVSIVLWEVFDFKGEVAG